MQTDQTNKLTREQAARHYSPQLYALVNAGGSGGGGDGGGGGGDGGDGGGGGTAMPATKIYPSVDIWE